MGGRYHASWCRACKAFAPKWEQLAQEYGGAYRFCDVDITVRVWVSTQLLTDSISLVPSLVFQIAHVDSDCFSMFFSDPVLIHHG